MGTAREPYAFVFVHGMQKETAVRHGWERGGPKK